MNQFSNIRLEKTLIHKLAEKGRKYDTFNDIVKRLLEQDQTMLDV